MKIAGIIAEYNPLHNGHLYHMEKTRELTGADYLIVLMSGDFVQRGEPALLRKHVRTEMALRSGADLVLELPLEYSTGSAEFFSEGAVRILDGLNAVRWLSFGSESGEIRSFQAVAPILCQEPPFYRQLLQENLRLGSSFPKAREKALSIYLSAQGAELSRESGLLSSPNNILGVEYCKALFRLNSSILPVTVSRRGGGYHTEELHSLFSSAAAIRKHLLTAKDSSLLSAQMPASVYSLLEAQLRQNALAETDDFSLLLKYALLRADSGQILQYQDVSPDLAKRIYNRLNQYQTFSQFTALLKTKELTYSRIQRSLLHILLGVPASVSRDTSCYPSACFARILGMKRSAGPLLSALRKSSRIPLIDKPAQAEKLLDKPSADSFRLTVLASNLWESVISQKTGQPFVHEFEKPMVIV